MSETEQSKAVVARFLEAFSRGDYDAAFTLVDEAVEWGIWTGELTPTILTKKEIKAQLEQARAGFAEPVAWNPIATTAEGDHVAVEIEGSALTKGGHRYRNHYHNLFIFRDGRIATVREMFEDAPVQALMAALAEEARAA